MALTYENTTSPDVGSYTKTFPRAVPRAIPGNDTPPPSSSDAPVLSESLRFFDLAS